MVNHGRARICAGKRRPSDFRTVKKFPTKSILKPLGLTSPISIWQSHNVGFQKNLTPALIHLLIVYSSKNQHAFVK